MAIIDNNNVTIKTKKIWEKPDISELKTSLTNGGKGTTGSETPAGPATSPS